MKKILHCVGFLVIGALMLYSSSAFAQGNVSSSGMKTSDDGTDYVLVGKAFHDIFSEPTEIDLNTNKLVYFQQELTVNNGTMTKYLAKFTNQDSTGDSWFQFASYPTVTKGNAKLTYTTDGINYSDILPALNDLVGYKMELTQAIVHPDDGNNQEPDLLISFTMTPKRDYILENNALNKDIVPFSGGYDSGGYGTYIDWRFGRGVHFTNIPIIGEDVQVVYEEEDGAVIHEPQLMKGNIGDMYDATTDQYKLVIPGYTLNQNKLPANATGFFTAEKQSVKYVYSKDPVAAADVTVKYQDTNGKELADTVIKTGNIGDLYSTEQKEFDGYTFKEAQGNTTGIFMDEAQTVIYIYEKRPSKVSNVIVKYQDTDGNNLIDDVVKTGVIGDSYTTEQKVFDGYTFKEIRGIAKGSFTDNLQVVTYIYERKIETTTNDQSNDKPAQKTTLFPPLGENNRYSKVLIILGTVLTIGVLVFWMELVKVKNRNNHG